RTLAGGDSPVPGVPASDYSARFTKTIDEGAGTYTFTFFHDDGVRILIDGESVFSFWGGSDGWTQKTVSVPLAAGPHEVMVEYFQAGGGAKLILDYVRTGAPDTTPPAAPTDVVANQGENSRLLLSWDASTSSDVVGYNVYRSTTPGVAVTAANKRNVIPFTGAEYVDIVAADTTYYYVVTAVDGAGNESPASPEATGVFVSTPDTEAPVAPTALAAVNGDATVTLTWTASAASDVAGYRVYRSLETGAFLGDVVASGDALVTGTTWVDPDADNGTTYFYQVTAVDTSGNESAPSNEAYDTPRPANTVDIKVDFTETNGVPVAGYLADWGQAYGPRSSAGQGTGLTYGWNNEDGNPLSLVGNGRDRNRTGIDPKLDSILHMQYADVDNGNGTNGVKTDGLWELALPGGLYRVTVAAGDQMGASAYDSQHTINVEGSLALNRFQGTTAQEFGTYTATVGVWDGRLTLDALGGFNTKISYVEVVGLPFEQPHITTVAPENQDLAADPQAGVAANFAKVHAGGGVDNPSMIGNVRVFKVSDNTEVAGSVNSSGGNDTINFYPDGGFLPNTAYRLEIGTGVKDLFGNAFLPFSSVFTTGAGVIIGGDEFTPLQNVAFEKVEITLPGVNKYWASFAFGPDGKMYGSTIGQGLYRFTVNADGTLSNMENLGYAGVAIIGLLWDKSSTAGDMKLWITKTSANVGNEQAQFISGISMLSGPNLQTEKKVFTGLPRSQSDHLTNSMVYGPNDDILVLQGSNQAAGDLDSSWGQRGEQKLTAALLYFDPDNARVQAAITDAEGDNPQLVQTASSGYAGENAANGYNAAAPYDPFAANAPLKIYASGIRNAYDLTYHSNGHIYVATNGTAGGGNSPGVTYNAANGTFTRVAAAGIPGFSSVNGQNVTDACNARIARTAADPTVPDYVPTSVPAVSNHPTQRDHLYDVKKGWYYGHPNPTRCEFVLHEGNDPAKPPVSAGQGGTKYASGVKAEPNYGGVAYDFEFNKSPNGTIEYKSKTFGGQLQNRVVVVRFSNNNDLIFLQADAASGKILGGQTEVGITGVANSTIGGVGGFNDPLEVVEDTRNGNLYVNQYDRAGSQQKLYLLRVPANQQAAKVGVDKSELVFSAVTSNGPLVDSTAAHRTDSETITVTNQSAEAQTLNVSVGGSNAAEFQIQGTVPSSLAPGASATFTVRFTPGTTAGNRSAQLTVAGGSNTVTVGLYGLAMSGIQGGYEPTFAQVVNTLGYAINVGWTNLAGGMQPIAKGDEVLEPLFVKSGSGNVTWKPLSHYAPADSVGFGWYTGDGAAAQRTQLGTMNGTKSGGYQSLLPPTGAGSTMSFDPGATEFGLYYYSPYFNRYGFTEDRLNSPAGSAHRARIYPAKNRTGVLIPNSYIVAFEDADNGDYQDYVFLVTGLKPVTDTGSGSDAIKVDFTTATGDLASGYLRDYGQAFGPRTGAGQGSGLTFGWKNVDTEDDLDISVGGTTNVGNGRDRNTSQSDGRLDSFMHMQPESIVGTFNGTKTDAYWEMQVPNGDYAVTIGVGDPGVQSDPEVHAIDVEGKNVVSAFTPSGAAGSNTRHKTSTATVTVTDGHLTVIASGTNTKIGFIDIVPTDAPNPGGDDPSDGAQVKVRFQPAAAPLSEGWTAETGGAFSAQRGYGWIDAATGQPVDRTVATRYRTAPVAGIAYPTDERLKTYSFLDNSTQPTYTSGSWEYAVPNGTYEVGVSVGDANYVDSTHGVLVEGQPIINGFVPTGTTPFQTGKRTVTVTDGRITISNSGTNTKVNWVSITGDGLVPTDPTSVARYSFRPATAPVPAGWTADTGAAYNAAVGAGWIVGGVPTDRSSMTRLRTAPAGDPTRQGLILMQATTTTGGAIEGGTTGVWERALANGIYTVTASVGDGEFTDSVHGLSAEGTSLISGFTPTTATPFTTGTAQVTVTDGRLSLSPTGVNTKLNWVTITGTALTAPSIVVNVNGSPVQNEYEGGEATVTASSVAASGSTISSLTYSVNGGAATPYGAPISLTTAGEYVLVFVATDSAGRTTTRTVELTVLNIGGTLKLTNTQLPRQADGTPLAGLSDDVVVLHRMNSGTTNADGALLYRTYDTATVSISNTGTKDLRITSLSLGGAQAGQFELVTPPTLPLLIAPGASQPISVKFIANSGSKGVRTATVTIASSDTTAATRTLQLRGGYMTAPEGGSELSLEQIFQLFNSTTTSGTAALGLGNGSELPGAPLDGEEYRSALWKRLDTTKPVQAVQLAAFHGQGGTETFTVGNLSASMTGLDAQAIWPKTGSGALTAINGVPNSANFALGVNGKLTSRTDYMAVKTWPVKDAAGKIVPGAWFLGHDYVSSGGGPTASGGCGNGATNCDYQDNVYLVTNVLPVTPDATAPAAAGAPTGTANATGVDLAWTASSATDVIGYRVERSATAGGTYSVVSGGGLVTGLAFRDTTAAPAATTFYRVVAVDATGNVTASGSTGVDTSAIVMAPIRINAGGGALTIGGVAWQADAFFSGGKTYSNTQVTQIAGTNNDALYLSERSSTTAQGSFSYNIPVPTSGNYQVILHFAEIYHGATGGGAGGTGKRVFSVNLEGGPVEVVNLDLNSKVAPMTAYTETRTIAVTDGTLNIAFSATVDQPKVSAIEVIRVP
ncbi:malectin domain-containing carbohydrate-binding protein, partial [Microbacterium radiodurans]